MTVEAIDNLPPPNTVLVDRLESLLLAARSGALQSMLHVCQYNDYAVWGSWVVPPRGRVRARAVLGELELVKVEFCLAISSADPNGFVSPNALRHDED